MPRRLTVPVIAVALIAAACGSAPATAVPGSPAAVPSPAGVPSPAAAAVAESAGPWLVTDLPQPSEVTAGQSLDPGVQCHPCHFLAENQLLGIGRGPAGLIAVGVEKPPGRAIAFASLDGRTWTDLPGFAPANVSAATAVAANGDRTVIVGSDSSGAAAWASTAGGAWTAAPPQDALAVPYAAGAMTSVISFGTGFVAAGYRDDPLHGTASAAVWRSDDGLQWHLDDAGPAFAGGRIAGLAATGGTIVAVGTAGDPNYGPAAAWRWTAGTGWQRATIGPDGGGGMRAVTATPSGDVAVGLDGHDTGARTWTSPDGLAWTAAPEQPSFGYFGLAVRMQSVVAVPGGLIAGGWRSDAGKGSGVTWTSSDGVRWTEPVWEPAFSGGQITGVATVGRDAVAVGRTGYPDWNRAAAWILPAP